MLSESDDQHNTSEKCTSPEIAKTVVYEYLDADQRELVQNICCGVYQNKKLLKQCTDLLYALNNQLRPSDQPFYAIVFYYLIFELPSHPREETNE